MAARCSLQPRGGTLLDELLVAALHGAVALPEVDGVAVQVGQHLDLDVPGMLDVFLQVDFRVAEGGLGLGLGLLEGRPQGQLVDGHPHAAAAPARRRLDEHGKAQLLGQPQGVGLAFDQALAAGDRGHSGVAGHAAGRVLVAHQRHRLVRGTDEFDVATAADVGEMGILRQEAVAGMDRLHVADLRGADHAVDLQVALRRLGQADAIGLVRQRQVGRAAVGLAENGHGLDAQLAAGTKNPQGDLTPVGNENVDLNITPAYRL